jgi:hypothetical protein
MNASQQEHQVTLHQPIVADKSWRVGKVEEVK